MALLAVRPPPIVTIFITRYLDDDLVLVGIEVVMPLPVLRQHVELLSRIPPALPAALPQKSVVATNTSYTAVMGTP